MPRPSELIGIGDFARRVRLTPKQLRDYDELALLAPAYVDPETGYRYYHRGQARTAVTIALLRSLDVPLADVHDLLVAEPATIATLLDAQKRRIEREVERGLATIRSLDRLLAHDDLLPYTVTDREERTRTLAGLHGTCEAEDLDRAVARTIRELDPGDAPVIGLYPLDLSGEVRYFVGIDAPIGLELPATRAAATSHTGPLTELQLAYFPLIAHVEERGLTPAAQVREIYLDDRTDVLLPYTGGPR